MPNELTPRLPEPGTSFENLVAVEKPATEALVLPTPTRRRRFIGGLAASTAAIIGGCSREPMSRSAFADLMTRLESAGSNTLARARDEIERFDDLQTDEKIAEIEKIINPDSKPRPPRKPVILPSEKDYATFLAGLKLQHIKAHEVLRPHRNVRSGVANTLPPKNMWNSMAPTLRVADKIRSRLGTRLAYINSAYRSPDYNAACPGAASRSYHMKNCALDLMFDCGSESAFTMAKKLRSEGVFKGGIGLYDSFIHIDTRGYHSTWGEA